MFHFHVDLRVCIGMHHRILRLTGSAELGDSTKVTVSLPSCSCTALCPNPDPRRMHQAKRGMQTSRSKSSYFKPREDPKSRTHNSGLLRHPKVDLLLGLRRGLGTLDPEAL